LLKNESAALPSVYAVPIDVPVGLEHDVPEVDPHP
jgi:hypothetical protein